MQSGLGTTFQAPGIIFDDDNNAAPDIAWASTARLAAIYEPDGKFHAAPELVVEILSPSNANTDRVAKLGLYSRRGVSEYWIVSWPLHTIEIYRYNQAMQQLVLVETLHDTDTLQTALLPGFSHPVSLVFSSLL